MWQAGFLHFENNFILEPGQINDLYLALRVVKQIITLVVDVAAIHIFGEFRLQCLTLIVIVTDGFNRGMLGVLSDLDHVNEFGF